MKKYKKILIIAAVIIQCAALGAMCYQREAVLATGDTVFIRTVPVDPRDLFRGDYVRLNYEISRISRDLIDPAEIKEIEKKEKRVYLSYELDSRNMVIPLKLGLKKPLDVSYIRGYTTRNWRNQSIGVRFSIEKYFMQQGKALALERGQRLEGVRIPLEMKTAIGKNNGIAVLKGMRYSDLGMGIVLPRRQANSEIQSFEIKVKLVNASDQPLYIIDPGSHETFAVEITHNPIYTKEKKIEYKTPRKVPEYFMESDIRTIAPKTMYEFTIDLGSPEFQLVRGEKEVSWIDMKYWETARIIYKHPEPEKLEFIKKPGKLWPGQVTSRSFSGYSFRD